MRSLASAALLGLALAVVPVAASAQAWPGKTIRIIVPYTPGGSSDIIARAISQPLADALKQSVIVENKPGANGNTGTDFVAKSPADGYTLLLCDVGALAITPSVYSKLPFDPKKDLRGVTMLAYSPHLLVVHPSVKANSLKELVALSQTSKLDFAVTAIGSAPHLAGVAVEKATKAKWQYIPYKGGSQAIGDTVAGQTQVLMNGMLATLPFVQSGKLKVLGVSKATRVPLLPDVPTIAEQGVPGFESGTWQGLLVPAGTPNDVVARLSAELTRIIRSPEIRSRLTAQGAEVYTMSPAEFVDLLRARAEALGRRRRQRRRQDRLKAATTMTTVPAAPYRAFPNAFKRRLLAGESLIGCWCSLANPITTEVLGLAGFDWLLLDGEHSPNDVTTFIPQLMALKDSASAPVVRPSWNDTVEIKRLLDAGFYNLLVPFVQTADDARRAVAATRYPPAGVRGVSVSQRSNRFGTVADYFRDINEQICVLVQIESRAGLEAAAEIAAVDGVDGLFVGPAGHGGRARPPRRSGAPGHAGSDRRRCSPPRRRPASRAASSRRPRPTRAATWRWARPSSPSAATSALFRNATQQLRDRFARSG